MGPRQKPLWNTNNHLPPSSCPHICAPQQTQQPLPHNKKTLKYLSNFSHKLACILWAACKYCFPHKASNVEKMYFQYSLLQQKPKKPSVCTHTKSVTASKASVAVCWGSHVINLRGTTVILSYVVCCGAVVSGQDVIVSCSVMQTVLTKKLSQAQLQLLDKSAIKVDIGNTDDRCSRTTGGLNENKWEMLNFLLQGRISCDHSL